MVHIMSKSQIVFGLIVGIFSTLGLFGVIDYPSYIQIPFVSLFVAIWLFTAGIHAKQMNDNDKLDGFLRWIYAPLVMVVILVDVFFNITWGSIIYREIPKEFLFTTRTKRHLNSQGDQLEAAKVWASRLNAIDPGHI